MGKFWTGRSQNQTKLKTENDMKKILLQSIFLTVGLYLQSQNLYVQPLGSGEQVPFTLAHNPKITFGTGTKKIESSSATQTFQLSNVQNLSFVKNTNSTNIATNLEDSKIHLYPNPVKDELTLVIQDFTQGINYRIFDMSGRLLKNDQIRSETTQINMQNFRAGVYILHIDSKGQSIQSFQIVKQ
jgi:hypothetical protein